MVIYIDRVQYVCDSSAEHVAAHALQFWREELRIVRRQRDRIAAFGIIQRLRVLRQQFFTARYTGSLSLAVSLTQGRCAVTL